MFDQGTLSYLRKRTEYGVLFRSELEPGSSYVTWSVPRRLMAQAVLLRQSTSVTPTCLPSHTDTGKVKTTQPSLFPLFSDCRLGVNNAANAGKYQHLGQNPTHFCKWTFHVQLMALHVTSRSAQGQHSCLQQRGLETSWVILRRGAGPTTTPPPYYSHPAPWEAD